MLIRRILPFFLALLLCAGLLSCGAPGKGNDGAETTGTGNGTETAYPLTFTDSTGSKILLEKKPEKVAVLFSSYADIWVTAGGQVDVTVGESVERGFADEGTLLVDAGSGHTTVDLETLIAASPDFVIGTADYDCQVSAAEVCRGAGIPAALFRVECFQDYLGVLEIFCRITGEKTRYATYGLAVKDEIDAILGKIPWKAGEGSAVPEILFIRAGSSAKSTKAKTAADNFVCVMLEELGSHNIASADNGLTGTLSLEAILEGNPDYLFITTMGDEAAAKDYMNALLQSDGWRELSCVASERYSYLPKDLFHYKPNARWAEAYAYLFRLLYPETSLT